MTPRENKIAVVSDLQVMYSKSGIWVFIAKYSGIDAASTFALRSDFRKADISMRIVKNTINSIAMGNTSFREMKHTLTGQVAVITSTDPVSVAKVIQKHVKSGIAIDVVAYSDGNTIYDKNSLEMLAKLPSISSLRSHLLLTMLAPATSLVRTMQASQSGLLMVLDQRSSVLS